MPTEMPTLYVKSARKDNRIALAEVDPRHPGGSVMVAGDIVAKVAFTPFVEERMREGELVEVRDEKSRKQADDALEARGEGTPPESSARELIGERASRLTDAEVAASGKTRAEIEEAQEKANEKAGDQQTRVDADNAEARLRDTRSAVKERK